MGKQSANKYLKIISNHAFLLGTLEYPTWRSNARLRRSDATRREEQYMLSRSAAAVLVIGPAKRNNRLYIRQDRLTVKQVKTTEQ